MALTVEGSFSVGYNLTMLCSTQSNPPAQLQWAFRGEFANTTGPLLELYGITEDQSGPYSCLAFNNHTNMNSSITSHITITSEFLSEAISASIFLNVFPASLFPWFVSTESPSSGSKQQAVSVLLLCLLLLEGFIFSLPGKM